MEIPGFAWDPDKKRYFKVLKTGHLPGSAYTISALASKDRDNRRKIAIERAKIAKGIDSEETSRREAETKQAHPRLTFEYKKLGKSAANVYTGTPDELISTICLTQNGRLVTGGRNGNISYAKRRLACAERSFTALTEAHNNIFGAVVDDSFGSIIASSTNILQLPQEFVRCLRSRDENLLIGTSEGVELWNLENNEHERLLSASVTSLESISPTSCLIGTSDGKLLLHDKSTKAPGKTKFLAKTRAITNIGVLNDSHSVVICGLEDDMKLFDMRQPNTHVLEFFEYKNWSTIRHGFALNKDKTAVCAAMDTCELLAWDAYSGTLLGPSLLKDSPSKLIPESIVWTSKGLYYTQMNSVKMLSRTNLGRASVAVEPPTEKEVSLLEQLSISLSTTVTESNQ